MPGAPHHIIDSWAPPQYVAGSSGAAGPVRSPSLEGAVVVNTGHDYDTTLHYKVGGTVIIALLTVFLLQYLGFRFVVAGSVGIG